jgi:hypothetical protein
MALFGSQTIEEAEEEHTPANDSHHT